MPETLIRYSDFQFQVTLPRGSWRWTTRVDNLFGAGSAQILNVITPYGLLRDSIPLPGEVVFAMADSIKSVGGEDGTTPSPHVAIVSAWEDLSAGDFVNILDLGGQRVRKAVATDLAHRAHAFVLSDVIAGQDAIVHFEGLNTKVAGLTPGHAQYLSPTQPGKTTEIAPSQVGQMVQTVGVATSPTAINFELDIPTIIAA